MTDDTPRITTVLSIGATSEFAGYDVTTVKDAVGEYPSLYSRQFDIVFIADTKDYIDAKRNYLLYQHHAPVIAFQLSNKAIARLWSEVKHEGKTSEKDGISYLERKSHKPVTLSIVTGTYNRLESLMRMIESARTTMPRGTRYEFVVIDGGSNDGTIRWCDSQNDIRLIKDGRLTGAISAFTRGAYCARGQFVIMANDDIAFLDGSIAKALAYMDDRPACGAVAFADNRLTGNSTEFRVAKMGGKHPKTGGQLIYAQVGMYRKWLGDYLDWWGAFTGMRNARTYGGDTWLSARIWESGYSVDAVKQVRIFDFMAKDELRVKNSERALVEVGKTGKMAHPDSAEYYQQYPNGPDIPKARMVKASEPDNLRILYLPIYASPEHMRDNQLKLKRGLRDALAKLGLLWEVDYRNIPNFNLSEYVKVWQPHLLITQYHGDDSLTPKLMAQARTARPSMVAINWCGDVGRGRSDSERALAVLEHFDLQMTKNANDKAVYDEHGIKWAYWQQGYEQSHKLPEMPTHDVVALMNIYSDWRKDLAVMLESLEDVNVGRYGVNWPTAPDGNTIYDYAAGETLYRNAKLAISDTFPGTNGFFSNRTVQCLGAGGAMLLLQKTPGLLKWAGLRSGTHYISWDDLDDLREKIAYWLDPAQEERRQEIVANGKELVKERYTFDALVRQLANEILPEVFTNA